MKKLVLGCLLVLGTVFLFNACSKDSKDDPISTTSSTSSTSTSSSTSNSGTSSGNGSGSSSGSGSNTTTGVGVVINGVKWATRNVATSGTFATNSYDVGMFYQWNSKVGWPSTGTVTGWNSNWTGGYTNPSSTDTWTSTNDPSPTGYRVPTYAEIQTLLDTTKVTHTWTTQNSVNGEKFTDKTTGNSIFLPASGYRLCYDGTLHNMGSYGYYWSSSAYGSGYAYGLPYLLYFASFFAYWDENSRSTGFSVRPVVE